MSDLISKSGMLLPLTVLGASALGSGHCLAMCGGMTAMFSSDRRSAIFFHLGRGIVYTILGSLAGFFGKTILDSSFFAYVPWLGFAFTMAALAFFGYRLIRNRPMHLRLPRSMERLQQKAFVSSLKFKSKAVASFFGGLTTGFLPCGWLYTYIFVAASSQTAVSGAAVMLAFWLGTIPILVFSSGVLLSLLKLPRASVQRSIGAIIILAVLSTVSLRLSLKNVLHKSDGLNAAEETEMECPLHRKNAR